MQERREFNRVIFKREVAVLLDDGETLFSLAQDFSMHGMSLLTEIPLDPGCELSVEFNILGQEDWREINLRGRVVYSKPEQKQFKSGITFDGF